MEDQVSPWILCRISYQINKIRKVKNNREEINDLKIQITEKEGLLKSSQDALNSAKKEFEKNLKESDRKEKDLENKLASLETEAKVFVNLIEIEEARLHISPLRKRRRTQIQASVLNRYNINWFKKF